MNERDRLNDLSMWSGEGAFWLVELSIVFVILSVLTGCLIAGQALIDAGAGPAMKRFARGIFLVLALAGGFAFIATPLIGSRVPEFFEWPVGQAENIIMTETGLFVVPLLWPSRIQLYDGDLRFIRGWHVPAAGGLFSVRPVAREPEQIEVRTARGNWRYRYDLDGNTLVSEESPDAYDFHREREIGRSGYIDAPLLLRPLADPFAAWVICAFGVLGSWYLSGFRRRIVPMHSLWTALRKRIAMTKAK